MERLTKQIDSKYACFARCEKSCPDGIYADNKACMCSSAKLALKKLLGYENAEEDGLLVRLPCKVGDRIWRLEKMINSGEWRLYGKETIVTDIYLNAKRPPLFKVTNLYGTLKLNDFGKTVFLTEEAAREQLKEVRNER